MQFWKSNVDAKVTRWNELWSLNQSLNHPLVKSCQLIRNTCIVLLHEPEINICYIKSLRWGGLWFVIATVITWPIAGCQSWFLCLYFPSHCGPCRLGAMIILFLVFVPVLSTIPGGCKVPDKCLSNINEWPKWLLCAWNLEVSFPSDGWLSSKLELPRVGLLYHVLPSISHIFPPFFSLFSVSCLCSEPHLWVTVGNLLWR